MSNPKFDVVIVGGGFSGTVLAAQLLRRIPNLSLAVIDNGLLPGRGVAYGTKHPCHLLNVPAANMSALPDQPEHFLRWAQANHDPSVQATSFLPRVLYGQYVASLLEKVKGQSGAGNFRWIQGQVSSFASEPSRVNVQLTGGSILATRVLVLAVGNFPPPNINVPGLSDGCKRYVPHPWSAAALKGIPKNGSVLLIGSGLTSVDVALALKSQGFAGHIHILSRRGLMPQPHGEKRQWPQFWNERSPRTIRGLLRLVRNQLRAASDAGCDWRSVIDALRPVTQKIWQSLPFDERKRFLRHVRPYWDAHRHRMPSEVSDGISSLLHGGQATLYAGRITNYREFSDYAEIAFRDRKTRAERLLRVDRVINCAGPETDYRRMDAPLIKRLLAQRVVRPDPLFLGLDVDANGALIASSGNPSSSLYAIGPVRKGFLWETTAVPELREQASQLASHLARQFASRFENEAADNSRDPLPFSLAGFQSVPEQD
ncbi:MAG: FAD/NAD(P)-binding protein [Candidatus Acidiferrales bacterium]